MKLKRETGDNRPIFQHLGQLSFAEFIFCCLNSLIGTGVLRLGSAFASGLLFSHVLNILIAIVSLYSLKLYVLSASCFHESTFEEIWSATFSRTTVIIPAICSILSSISNIVSYLSFLQGSVVTILSMIIKMALDNTEATINNIEKYTFLIGIMIVFVVCVPISFSNNMRLIFQLSIVSVSCFLFILIYVIIRFFLIISKNGFDPNKRFKLVDFNSHISGSISSFTFAYLLYPFAWPGLRHSKNPTPRNLSKTFYVTIGACYVLYSLMGTFSYFSFFDENTGGIILDYYPSDTITDQILLIIGHIATFIYIMLTIPNVLNSARYILLNTLHKKDEFPKDVWVPIGIMISFISLVLANITSGISNYIFIVRDLLTLVQLFIFPPIFYLRGYGTKNKLHFVCSILELILGVVAIGFIIYADCFE